MNQPFFWLKPLPLILRATDPAKKFIPVFHTGFTSLTQLAILLLMQPIWFSGLQMHVSSSCQASCQPTPPSFLPRAALNPFYAQPVFVLRIALTQVEHLALGIGEI